MRVHEVISGGQTGVETLALRVARDMRIETGGWAAAGWIVEAPGGNGESTAPRLAEFGLVECPSPGYPSRTMANVATCDALLYFGGRGSADSSWLNRCMFEQRRPGWFVKPGEPPKKAADWLLRIGASAPGLGGGGGTVSQSSRGIGCSALMPPL